jgi:outer membrane protein assembly factor BamB
MSDPNLELPPKKGVRWWPAAVILVLASAVIVWIRFQPNRSFQERNIATLGVLMITLGLLFLWWVILSRTGWRLRLAGTAAVPAAIGLMYAMFHIRGVSGDLIPILEPRWAAHGPGRAEPQASAVPTSTQAAASTLDYPQFLGPDRTGRLDGPALDVDWKAHPPQILWRQRIGAAWSGWAVVGSRALTQEQRGEEECCTCYDVLTGRLLWSHADPAHYNTTIAGEGPRCTPTVVSNRVFALGALGALNCLDLETGQKLWSHNIADDAKTHAPGWGFAGSPLVFDGKVIVSAGGSPDHSLLAYRADTGELAWAAGSQGVGYGSPFLATLAGFRQILAFNSHKITAHDAQTGAVLWEYPWGVGQPHVAVPVVVSTNRVLFSSGYGVGSELLEIQRGADSNLSPSRLWKSIKMKAKFANPVEHDGFLYGLDDGVLACLNLKDGTQPWKEGRYGHGQGLLVRDLLLLMAENGELVLLRPTPDAPNELVRFPVFSAKTWNPIALAGDLLLVRNDQEAACLRLAVQGPLRAAAAR